MLIRIWKNSGVPGIGHSRECRVRPPHWVLFSGTCLASMFESLVRRAVEKHISCQHLRNPSDALFLHTDLLVVILVITCLKCSSNAFRGESLHQYPGWQPPEFNIHEFLLPQWINWCHLGVQGQLTLNKNLSARVYPCIILNGKYLHLAGHHDSSCWRGCVSCSMNSGPLPWNLFFTNMSGPFIHSRG